MGLIASGALLIVAPAADAEKIMAHLGSESIPATVIGAVTDRSRGIKMLTADGLCDLPLFEQDELTKI
jgi:hydrogenase maturation factor